MINKVITIAKEAGELIREGFKQNISIEYKTGDNNLVTNIDKAAEKIILDFIKKEYPYHSVIAEESGTNAKSSDYTWVIDPIDGTTNFAHKLPIFCVSIGIQKNKETILGVIYDVMRDKIYSTEKGSGAFENNERISVSANDSLRTSNLVTGFAYDMANVDTELEIFGKFIKKSRAVRRLGSAAIDMCYVASGVFDGFWETKLNPWDVCAGMLLVEEAGGKVTNYSCKTIDVFSDEFLLTNGLIHNAMVQAINERT